MADEQGIVISIKEMYEVLQEIKSQVSVIESEVKNIGQTDERSRKALELASDAWQKANDLERQIEKIEGRQQWLQGLIVSGVILGLIGTLFFIVQKGLIGG